MMLFYVIENVVNYNVGKFYCYVCSLFVLVYLGSYKGLWFVRIELCEVFDINYYMW